MTQEDHLGSLDRLRAEAWGRRSIPRSLQGPTSAQPRGLTLAGLRLVLIVAMFACGCNGTAIPYKLYPGEKSSLEELAVVRFGEQVTSLRINGMRVARSDYDRIELLPGSYEIDWRTTFSVSPMVKSSGQDEIEAVATVDLEAGHEYTVNSDRTTGRGYTMRWWLEDMTTRTVLAGRKWE